MIVALPMERGLLLADRHILRFKIGCAALCWSLLALLLPGTTLAAPDAELWAYWQTYDEHNPQTVDHSAWQNFLDVHVVTGADGIVRVDYALAVKLPEVGGDTALLTGRRILAVYLDQLTQMNPLTLNRHEQMAYWINLYNALTVEVVLRYPAKKSILRMGKRLFVSGPWDDKLIEINGESVSLNDIEHRILRPIWQDHRIHFAVNCASLGCPNLSPRAYSGSAIEAQLAIAEASYINHPRGLSLVDDKLTVSSIFDWYRDDFADSDKTLLAYLAQHQTNLSKTLQSYTGRISYAYDWTLNKQ